MADPVSSADLTQLKAVAAKLGIGHIERHIFLCAEQEKPKCAPAADSMASWNFLKGRLADLGLTKAEPCVYRAGTAPPVTTPCP